MGKFVDLSGQQYGWLTPIEALDERSKSGSVLWRCACRCGAEVKVISSSIRSGNTVSCGCYHRFIKRAPDDLITYRGAHTRIVRERGAAACYPCTDCGDRAEQWALRPGVERRTDGPLRFSPDPLDYEPKCVACHALQDKRNPWRTPRSGMSGADSPTARLTTDEVREIRRLYSDGGVTQYQLAEMFGCSQSNVSFIVRRETRVDS